MLVSFSAMVVLISTFKPSLDSYCKFIQALLIVGTGVFFKTAYHFLNLQIVEEIFDVEWSGQ
jgi:hypothetical protein